MQVSELAKRYARALFELATQSGSQDRVLDELRVLQGMFEKDEAITEFLSSPILKAEERQAALKVAFKDGGLSPETLSFVLLLAQKNRMRLFSQIVNAVKEQSDLAHGVTRGTVRSAIVLSPEERKRVEDIVSQFSKKQVILTYKEDPSVIGGLIAEAGSYTFDDTLTSHLRRLKDETTRRV
jgi:F-type H+-transporting ATPase subunit delta